MPHATQDIFLYKQKTLPASSLISNILLAPPPRSPLGEKSSVGRGSPRSVSVWGALLTRQAVNRRQQQQRPFHRTKCWGCRASENPTQALGERGSEWISYSSNSLIDTDSKMLKTWEVSDKDSLDLGSIFSVPVVLPTLQVLHCPHFLL